MKVIDFETIRNMGITPLQCYEWVSDMLTTKNETILPANISMTTMNGVFYNVMPTVLLDDKRVGVKVVTRYPERNPSLESEILLYNLENGELLAILDGTYITAMRTGAVAAHSIKLLAKKDFKTLGFMGLGNTARATMKILEALFPDREMTIKLLKYKNQHEQFKDIFSSNKNLKFEICDTCQQLVKGSDVIVSAVTVFEDDVCEDECFDEGCLLVPIHTRGFTNCDLFFDKIFADDVNHVKGFKNFDKFKSFAEVADVVSGKVPGRESDTERIIAYNIGIAIHDMYYADKIYEMSGKTPEITLNPPKDQFWIK